MFRKCLSESARLIFKLFFSIKNVEDYTCNFRAYKFELIKKLLKNKNFFKNEDFNIAAKIILFLTRKVDNMKLSEVPFILNYHYKIGQSKMRIIKTIFLTIRLLLFKKA